MNALTCLVAKSHFSWNSHSHLVMRQLPQLEMRHFPLPRLVNMKLERKVCDFTKPRVRLGALPSRHHEDPIRCQKMTLTNSAQAHAEISGVVMP
jgi:hypothetical protein